MTNAELQILVEKISLEAFNRPFLHHATFNARLKTTGGRYILKTHNLDFNPLMLTEFDLDNLIGVIKHELVHYHNHLQGLGYQHKDAAFKAELMRVGGSRFAPKTSQVKNKVKRYWVYTCEKGHALYRQRRIDTVRYVCGQCRTKLTLTGRIER
ncbi:MAG: SprT family protein [Lactobacillaceae bacterium]|jgi:SprT-like protein|nr:SprT family protein [Lactobacillaceae bacterium]